MTHFQEFPELSESHVLHCPKKETVTQNGITSFNDSPVTGIGAQFRDKFTFPIENVQVECPGKTLLESSQKSFARLLLPACLSKKLTNALGDKICFVVPWGNFRQYRFLSDFLFFDSPTYVAIIENLNGL